MDTETIRVIANVKVGRADVTPAAPAHVPGVFQGNRHHVFERGKGIHELSADLAIGSARRSTGIRPGAHDVIDPRMPKLSPA